MRDTHRTFRHTLLPLLMGGLLISALLLAAMPTQAAEVVAQGVGITATAAPLPPGYQRDRCEQNDSLVQPCAIQTEVETGDLTFVDDAIDVYSVLLKAGRTYTIRAASTTGIDPRVTLYLAGATEQPIAQNDDLAPGSGDAAVQITTSAAAWYLIQIDNAAPGDMRGRTYSLSVRSSAPAGAVERSDATTPTPPGDAFENNWRLEDAPRLAWGVPYDLSLVCPELRFDACPSGDHDFFLVTVKRGVPFVALTYDLGPGADTTLALYRPQPGVTDPGTGLAGWQLVQGNDDAVQGRTLASQVLITPDWDGAALLIVAASDRRDPPRVPEAIGPAGRYRLILGSPFLPAVQQVLGAQQGATETAGAVESNGGSSTIPRPSMTPMPAPNATVLPTPATPTGDAEEIIRETCLTGVAMVINPEGARFSAAAVPSSAARLLMIYPHDTTVELLGACYLGWVKVRPLTSVSPGWMYAPDLALSELSTSSTPTIVPDAFGADGQPTDALPPANMQPTARPVLVEPLPTRITAAPTALPRQALTVAVQIVDPDGIARPGVRVQLVDVFGSVLRDGTTDAQGQIAFVVDMAASAAVWAQVPAAGITIPIDRATPSLRLVLPRD